MIYFISDVHLGIYERKDDKLREDILLEFFKTISKDCELLYIVGDLFDYWFEYKTVVPKYFYRTLSAINDMRQNNIEIEYVMGNHDFGHKNFFYDEFGIEIQADDIERIHNGKRFYISHGDGKTFNDGPYKVLKKILRNPLSLKLYLLLHPNIGIKLASTSSRKSRHYTNKKYYGEVEGMDEFAQDRIKEGFDFVVMGHRHKAKLVNYGKGYYLNLGDWLKVPTYGVFDGENIHLRKVSDLLGYNIEF